MGIAVAIVEENRRFRDPLARRLNETPGFRCVGACRSAEAALAVLPRRQPDVILVDLHLPKLSGVDCTRRLKELCPAARSIQTLARRSRWRLCAMSEGWDWK